MATQGPSYGLSRECAIKSQAKFSVERARECVTWMEAVLEKQFDLPEPSEGVRDHNDFQEVLKDGVALCELINSLKPGSVGRINKQKMTFKQRENIELFLKGCGDYGLKTQDLFQVNDLFEGKNLYMVVDNLYSLGGLAQKLGYSGPALGVRKATENKRAFDPNVIKAGASVIGLQYGSNKGASQQGMTAYGTGRQIRPDESIQR